MGSGACTCAYEVGMLCVDAKSEPREFGDSVGDERVTDREGPMSHAEVVSVFPSDGVEADHCSNLIGGVSMTWVL